ncbi:MAG: S9 family peptidase [Bacteroidales bacterium]|nr:S9 family peptidase [Bacteroidales bacterium]
MKKLTLLVMGTITLMGCNQQPKQPERYSVKAYPETRMDETVVDDYFGTKVADPYRWLENDTSAETAQWVKAQNEVTQDYLSHIPFRSAIKDRLTQIVNYERYSMPSKKHGRYIYSKNDGLQNQSVIYMQETLDGEPTVLLDPNKLSDDGTVSLGGISFSNDGKYMAYTIQRSGSDWVEIYVKDMATLELLPDHIEWAKFTGASWYKDGFFYAAYDRPEAGKEFSNVNENHKIYYHKLGTPQEQDELFYSNPKQPRYFHQVDLTEDEHYMFLFESGQGAGSTLWIRDMQDPKGKFVQIADDMDYQYSPIDVIDGTLYIFTNYNAPKGRICKVSAKSPQMANWVDVIPECENVISGISLAKGKMIVTYDKDAANHAYVYTMDGQQLHEIALPTYGSVGFSSEYKEPEVFYAFTSFVFPTTIYQYNIDDNTSTVFRAPAIDFKSDDYVTEQVFVTSKDGTKVPMFLTYKKGLQKDGNNATFLYGYGGFNVTLNPGFSTSRLPFIENGGIYAQMNLRGGNEYGEEWHIAGTKLQKQNVFDDCIACAEYLINNKYTSPKYLALNGGSNGGLLVGAVVNQRPDLFAVAVPQVGVMDMLRYHLFTIGWNWASDYGTSEDDEAMFKALYAYSPLHTIKSGADVHYPAIMVTTADHDDRVVPAHSFKYAAALQAAQTGDQPKIIRIDTKAGHGGGKPISKVIEEQADIYSFILYNMGLTYPKEAK